MNISDQEQINSIALDVDNTIRDIAQTFSNSRSRTGIHSLAAGANDTIVKLDHILTGIYNLNTLIRGNYTKTMDISPLMSILRSLENLVNSTDIRAMAMWYDANLSEWEDILLRNIHRAIDGFQPGNSIGAIHRFTFECRAVLYEYRRLIQKIRDIEFPIISKSKRRS